MSADDPDRHDTATHNTQTTNELAVGAGEFRPEWDQRCVALWLQINDVGEADFCEHHRALLSELHEHSPVVAFERAALHDSFGRPDLAIPLYEAAIAGSVPGERRRRAVIQMASSHRNMGNAALAAKILKQELDEQTADHLSGAVRTFLALALNDLGREREALAIALTALSEYLPRYNRSVARFAGEIDATLDQEFWPPTIPELVVCDFVASLSFYTEVLGFEILYTRGAPDFAMLRIGRVQLMLEQLNQDVWLTGDMTPPLGRGINIEMEHPDPESLSNRLLGQGITLYRPLFTVTRELANGAKSTSVEFLIQDPDGYLLRFVASDDSADA
jgi:catechol 2,3-dioxygenase-like lactoylglutathione lyase family enzyme